MSHSNKSPEMVRWMLRTMGLPEELVGRPDAVRFGPFVFRKDNVILDGTTSDIQINDVAGTVDKKLTSLDSDQKYWLLLSGFRQFWSFQNRENELDQSRLFELPYLKMERNDQNTFEQLAWASNPQTVGTASTVAAVTLRAPRALPPYMFKWWWVLDGESDRLSINSDFDATSGFSFAVASYTWTYGFAIKKSVMETFPSPECGPAALAKLADQGPASLQSVASILGVS